MKTKPGELVSIQPTAKSGQASAVSLPEPERPTVLFFGRHGCPWTQKIYQFLLEHAQSVEFFESHHRGELPPDRVMNWSGDLIFSFRSFHILSVDQIRRAAVGAINFHPGPPEYPGSGCINWALLDGAKEFGVTAHLMSEKIDSGAILAVDRFDVFPSDNIETLLSKTHEHLGTVATRIIETLFSLDKPGQRAFLATEPTALWTGKVKPMGELDNLRRVPVDISRADLDKRIRAVHHPSFPLYVELAGHKFQLYGSQRAVSS
jgi:methionyl-tRNA formyltransferase